MPMIRFFVLFLIVTPFFGYTQNKLSSTYHISHYTDENGLTQNSVKSLSLDEKGYLWMATEDGLVRFDGQSFFRYNKAHTNTHSSRIKNLIRDLNTGELFGKTEHRELIPILDGVASRNPLLFNQVFTVPTSIFYSQNKIATELPDLDSNFPFENFFIHLSNEKHYLITRDSLIVGQNNKTIKIPFRNDGTRGFFVLNELLFHFDESGQFVVFNTDKMKAIPLTGDLLKEHEFIQKDLKVYWNSSMDQAFIYSNRAFFELSYANDELVTTSIISEFDFNERKIVTTYYDKLNKRLFLGSNTQGLFVIQLPIFDARTSKANQENVVNYALYPYGDGSTLFANGSLLYSDGKTSELPLVQQSSNNFSLAIDQDKNIWTQKDSIIYKLSPNADQVLEQYTLPYKSTCLYIDNENTLWIGTEGAIYLKKLKTAGLPPVVVTKIKDTSFLLKENNLLWIGTFNGLYQYNLINKNTFPIPKTASMHIRSLYNRDNELWISTYGDGFYLYKAGQLTQMPLDHNQYLANSHCLLEDAKGYFWISTNKGLFQASIKDLLAFSEGKVDNVFYLYYAKSFGFNTNEFNGGCQPCASIQNDDTFIFPSLMGSVQFNPNLIKPELPNKPIIIDRITIDSIEIPLNDTVNAKADFGRMNIQVSSPYFGNPENLNFEYKLGDKGNLIKVNPDQTISFSTLPHGTHELHIRKSNGFNQDDFEYRILVIQVSPFYYQTWWFRLGVALVLIGVTFYIFKMRNNNALKRNKQLEILVDIRTADLEKSIVDLQESQGLLKEQTAFQKRLIAAITHDIKSPLKYLMVTSKYLYHNDGINGPIKDSIRAIYISSSNMFYFTDNLLNYSKLFVDKKKMDHELINLRKLVIDKTSTFSEIVMHNKIKINNNIPLDINILTEKITLSVILHNLIDNAIKFSSNGTITFNTKKIGDTLVLNIMDTGCGLCPEILEWLNAPNSKSGTEGLGLKTVKHFAHRIPLKIEADSTVGIGTHIRLIFNEQIVVIRPQNKIQLSAQKY